MMTLTWLATGLIHVFFSPALVHQYETRCNGAAPVEAPKKKPVAPNTPKPIIDEVEPAVEEGNDWD